MGDESKGLYEKYKVKRTDGSSKKGKKHHKCVYFVLDLVHDKYSRYALMMYTLACEDEFPKLAEDLRNLEEHLRKRAIKNRGK